MKYSTEPKFLKIENEQKVQFHPKLKKKSQKKKIQKKVETKGWIELLPKREPEYQTNTSKPWKSKAQSKKNRKETSFLKVKSNHKYFRTEKMAEGRDSSGEVSQKDAVEILPLLLLICTEYCQ